MVLWLMQKMVCTVSISTGLDLMDNTLSITRHWLEEGRVEVLSLIDTRHRLGGREMLFLSCIIIITDTRHRLEGKKVLFLTNTNTDNQHRLTDTTNSMVSL